MEKYWKLLDLKEHEYSTHETEEEINHIIEFKTRNMEDDRVIRRIDIKTQFPNYNFQYVVAFDSENIYYFLYFFDSIEEQCDCFEEELYEKDLSNQLDEITKQRDNAINLLNKKTTDLFNANRTIDYLKKHNNELKELISKINDLTHPF